MISLNSRPVLNMGFACCALLLVCCVCSCRKKDVRVVRIRVPEMSNDRVATIVRNALELELRRDDQNFSANLKTGVATHTGRAVLASQPVQERIKAGIQKVGFAVESVTAKHKPNGNWRDRHVVSVRVPDMKDKRSANIVTAAIARAVKGKGNKNVVIDRDARIASVTYDSFKTSFKNLEHIVANSGFQANEVPANLGGKDALRHGW